MSRKLTESQVEVNSLLQSMGLTYEQIKGLFGVASSTVREGIANGRSQPGLLDLTGDGLPPIVGESVMKKLSELMASAPKRRAAANLQSEVDTLTAPWIVRPDDEVESAYEARAADQRSHRAGEGLAARLTALEEEFEDLRARVVQLEYGVPRIA